MLTLIIGGARSGKSDLAQRIGIASAAPVVFIATMQPLDDETRHRVETHRAGRPTSWTTIEAPDDPLAALEAHARPGYCVVVDCLTLWISNLLLAAVGDAAEVPADRSAAAVEGIVERAAALAHRARTHEGEVIVVTNEVGLGVVPPTPLGRHFRDALGGANREFASRATRVYQVTAGLALDLNSLGARPLDAFGQPPPEPHRA